MLVNRLEELIDDLAGNGYILVDSATDVGLAKDRVECGLEQACE